MPVRKPSTYSRVRAHVCAHAYAHDHVHACTRSMYEFVLHSHTQVQKPNGQIIELEVDPSYSTESLCRKLQVAYRLCTHVRTEMHTDMRLGNERQVCRHVCRHVCIDNCRHVASALSM